MSEHPVVETDGLGKRYGSLWALRDCSLSIPAGSVVALVVPNGAGKTTLLHLLVGLNKPTAGDARILGWSPREQASLVLPRVGFVAQDHPLYRGFTLAETLKLGGKLNPRWDDDFARGRVAGLGIPLGKKVGKLSGGQQAQVALTLALAKRPDLLVLDEPVASLDPLARREFLQALMEAVADEGLTVILSSHIVAELERVCDHLVILAAGGVQLAGPIEELLRTHRVLSGPRRDVGAVARTHAVIQERHTARQTTLFVRGNGPVADPSWSVDEVTLEEIVLAYLGLQAAAPAETALELAS
jgi:ABC-2 type transport system ATP-binding protein